MYTLYHVVYFINKLIYEIINFNLLIMWGGQEYHYCWARSEEYEDLTNN